MNAAGGPIFLSAQLLLFIRIPILAADALSLLLGQAPSPLVATASVICEYLFQSRPMQQCLDMWEVNTYTLFI
jgi:hypothetical protein